MSNIHEQIKTAFEELGMTVEEIASDQKLDIGIVKTALIQCSSKYRASIGMTSPENSSNNPDDFTDEDLHEVNEVIRQIAKYSEDEHLRFKAATYVRDDKKGRKNIIQAARGITFNLLQINQRIQEANKVLERGRNGHTVDLIPT